jgi:hypothetical protein
MFKSSFILILSFQAAQSLPAQKLAPEDYKVYSALIKIEISDTAKSISVIRRIIKMQETKENISFITDAFKSKNSGVIYAAFERFETDQRTSPVIVDSVTQQFIIDYSEYESDNFRITNEFNLNSRIFLLRKPPIKRSSIEKDWLTFYRKHPGSEGIFSFSKIKYSPKDNTTAIFYYWHLRNGLNGHGTLAIMKKVNNDWKLKYRADVWMN